MRILVAQLDPTIGDFSGNLQKILHALEYAHKEKVEVVLFPELTICGYPPEDLVLHGNFVTTCENILEKIVPHTKGVMVVVGLVRRNLAEGEKSLLNSAAIIQDGKFVGFYDIALHPTYDVFDERRYFEPWTEFRSWEWIGQKNREKNNEQDKQHTSKNGDTRY